MVSTKIFVYPERSLKNLLWFCEEMLENPRPIQKDPFEILKDPLYPGNLFLKYVLRTQCITP